jgi:hypothetical protein
MELETDCQLPFLDILVNQCPNNSLGYAIYRKATHTDRYLQAASHYPPGHKRSVITVLMHRANSVMRLAEPQNDSVLGSFSEPVATPCTISTEHPNPDPPRWVPGKENHRAYLPYIQGAADHISRLLQKHDILTIQKPHNKMASRFNSTKDRQLPTQKSGVYKIQCSCGKA